MSDWPRWNRAADAVRLDTAHGHQDRLGCGLGQFAMKRVCLCTMMASCCSRATWCMPQRGANHISAQDTKTIACGSCDARFSGCRGCMRVDARLVCMHAGPTGCCSGWRHCRTACIRCDTWDPGRALSRLAATTYSPFRRRYSLLVHDSVATGRYGMGDLGPWGGGPQKKLKTQKRGPSGANWLRMEMPCRGN